LPDNKPNKTTLQKERLSKESVKANPLDGPFFIAINPASFYRKTSTGLKALFGIGPFHKTPASSDFGTKPAYRIPPE
jgi:hypothetical protein